MIVYHFDPDTGAFLNTSSEADESPLEPGVFVVPANATELLPPSLPNPKTQHAVFRDGGWLIEDKPLEPLINRNIAGAPLEGLFPRISIKEALKGGVT